MKIMSYFKKKLNMFLSFHKWNLKLVPLWNFGSI